MEGREGSEGVKGRGGSEGVKGRGCWSCDH